LGTGEPCRTGRHVSLFLMFEAHGSQGVAGRVGAHNLQNDELKLSKLAMS
jgi:hypothetical protein